jgi:hypothetical protein
VFAAGLGGVAWRNGEAFVVVAGFLAVAWLISLIFNAQDRRMQLWGVILPTFCGFIGGAIRSGIDPLAVAIVVWLAGGAAAAGSVVSSRAARASYVGLMRASEPIGWTVSIVVMGLVYYVVLTPIGVAMRLFGYDPMDRVFDRSADSYWIQRRTDRSASEYFRQF